MYLEIKKRASYYPSIYVTQTQTPFGAIETDNQTLYDSPIVDKIIYKVDALSIISEMFGDSILSKRDITYKLFSGNLSDCDFRKVIKSYYSKFPSFANHIDSCIMMGNEELNHITNIIQPVRKLINDEINNILDIGETGGGKLLMMTNDYIYFSFAYNPGDIFKSFSIIV